MVLTRNASAFFTGPSRFRKRLTLILLEIKKELKAALPQNSLRSTLLLPISLFFVIAAANLCGLLPFVFTASSHLVYTISLALPLWTGHIIIALSRTPLLIAAHLVPLGTPGMLIPLIVIIELVRRTIRPLTLSVRLGANMIAGHLLLILLGSRNKPYLSSALIFSGIALTALIVLEIAVSLIQAYVFSILFTLYVAEVCRPATQT